MLREWSDREEGGKDWLIKLEFGLMCVLFIGSLFIALATLVWPKEVSAHPGGLAADGCHNDRKNGGRHCHRAPTSQQRERSSARGHVYYPNCAAARAAGVAPVRRGDPVYAAHLDRDNDGVGCE